MSNTRLYLVAACIGGQTQAPRLIEAGTAAAARNHATKDWLTIKPASPKEVAKLISDGVKLEIATEVPPEQPALPGTEGTTATGDGSSTTATGDGSTGGGEGAGSGGTGEASGASDGSAETADAGQAEGTTRTSKRRNR